ncbi:MAG: translation initiation factor IF-2 [bacterium]|nr:translation initiation factor IF-2 [bacterium]
MAIPTNTKTKLKSRPPVVVIMGHIDHGKSTLLDYIRKSNITEKEAGGITQHLGAYEVAHIPEEGKGGGKSGLITFLDTPGHSAFSGIRTRGASAADIAILIVSAEDGFKPQTKEAFETITKANIPYIVAITKIDKPSANVEKTKMSLVENGIYLEGLGGDIPFVPISSITGEGVSDLLDLIILMAEMAELKSDENVPAKGIIVEAHLDQKKGIAATLIIKEGTLSSGMYIVANDAISPIRIFENCYGRPIKEAKPGRPATVIGFDKIPELGSIFESFNSKKEAEKAKELAEELNKENKFRNSRSTNINDKQAEFATAGGLEKSLSVTLPLIIKADTVGSIEGIRKEMSKFPENGVVFKILYEGVGDISETDVKTAVADPETLLIGFNVKVDSRAGGIVERFNVKVKTWDIIYNLVEFLANLKIDRKPKIKVEESTGILKVLQTFSKEKDKQVIGGKVQEGYIKIGSDVKILRRDLEIGRGKIRELQQSKKRADEVAEGFECGLLVESKIEIAYGDKIQCFITVEK